jgi:hypothetical protein
MPLAKDLGIPSGLNVTPAWEGWYPNPDGTSTIYFGYYTRNREEVVHIPVGSDNQVTVAGKVVDAGQPTVFQARRNYGVFGVQVPGDFSDEVVWTLRSGGKTYAIPASLNPVWKTDQLEGDADGNFGPTIRLAENGKEVQGPLGTEVARTATVGVPVELSVWGSHVRTDAAAEAEAPAGGRGRAATFRVEWDEHAGPGRVVFSEERGTIPDAGGMATTSATFDTPGTYVVRVTASRSGVAGSGHSQCCWTNGFVRVSVSGR